MSKPERDAAKDGGVRSTTRPIRPGQMPAVTLTCLAVLVLYGAAAIFGKLIAPHSPTFLVGDGFDPPRLAAPFGADYLGRDILSRLLHGSAITVGIPLAATLLACVIGVVLGIVAAVLGGWVDSALSRLVDALMAIPSLVFALVVLSGLGTSLPVLIGVMAVVAATRFFRLSRAVAMDIVVMEFIEAARLRGEGLAWIVGREVLPNALPPLIAEFGLRFGFAILLLSALSFLGVGVQPPLADWGYMVRENAQGIALGRFAPLFPALAIGLLCIAVNLTVDWFIERSKLAVSSEISA